MPRRGDGVELLDANGLPEIGEYEQIPSLHELDAPHLMRGESGGSTWQTANLDRFFIRLYTYMREKGFWVIITSRVLNVVTLGFTIVLSGFLLMYVNWGALTHKCIGDGSCDILKEAVYQHPLQHGSALGNAICVLYLIIFSVYWLWTCLRFVLDFRETWEIRDFCNVRLGVSDRELQTITWPELVDRVVAAQRTLRLCLVKELTPHDIVSRIMRKENYLIAMLNMDVLGLGVNLPGGHRHVFMTKTLEWNLYWTILDQMFDDNFTVRHSFLNDEGALRQRLGRVAAINILLSPFTAIFMTIYFFLRNAEKFYHHPSSIGARRWTSLAKWKLREFNELPHFFDERLTRSIQPAEKYVTQFPSPIVSMLAKFVAFVVGSFAAILLVVAFIDEALLEAQMHGRNLLWYAAVFGTVLAISRSLIMDDRVVYDPEGAMGELVLHTHYMPKHWRGKCGTPEVQRELESLFQFKAVLFLEELASIFVTPLLLWKVLPARAGRVLAFVRDFTVHVDGMGDLCSLSVFDFERHGNRKYGSPFHCEKGRRSRQGKMEKSFVSFQSNYPSWQPGASGARLAANLSEFRMRQSVVGGGDSAAASSSRAGGSFLAPPGARGGAAGGLRGSMYHSRMGAAGGAAGGDGGGAGGSGRAGAMGGSIFHPRPAEHAQGQGPAAPEAPWEAEMRSSHALLQMFYEEAAGEDGDGVGGGGGGDVEDGGGGGEGFAAGGPGGGPGYHPPAPIPPPPGPATPGTTRRDLLVSVDAHTPAPAHSPGATRRDLLRAVDVSVPSVMLASGSAAGTTVVPGGSALAAASSVIPAFMGLGGDEFIAGEEGEEDPLI